MVSIVTDELVLRMLAQWGIDKNHVELWHDYAHRGLGKEYSPYAKFYQDYASKNRIMVVSGLPKVNANGDKICGNSHNETTVGWESKAGRYLTKPNIFSGIIDGLGIELSVINDQPWGAKKGDSVSWVPRLFLNGVEQFPTGAVTLYPTDPVNGNYHHNVIELNYGICKRQVRIIEGRFKERWVFPTNPTGDVRIKHNFVGSLKLKLGYARDASGEPLEVLVTDDEELIPATAFAEAVYPVEIGASQTFYPDAHEETSSVDGIVYRSAVNETWDTIHDHTDGNNVSDSTAVISNRVLASSTTNQYEEHSRGFLLFDSSGLPDTCTISAVVLSLYGVGGANALFEPEMVIVSSNPASNTALGTADFDQLGTTAFSNTIAYSALVTDDYNDFTLNASGRAVISKTGISKFGCREDTKDRADVEPSWVSGANANIRVYSADQGSGFKPKLVVTYSIDKSSWAFRNAGPGRRARRKAVFYPDLVMGLE